MRHWTVSTWEAAVIGLILFASGMGIGLAPSGLPSCKVGLVIGIVGLASVAAMVTVIVKEHKQ